MARSRGETRSTPSAATVQDRSTETLPAGGPELPPRRVFSTLAHEVRVPLAAIRSYTEILLNCPPPDAEERREFLKAILEESDRIRRLLDDMGEIERLEAGTQALELAPCDLVELAERAVLAVYPLATTKRIDIESESVCDVPPVRGEADRLARAIYALVENAVKFTETGGEVRVRVVAWEDSDTVSIEVADNGIGVPAAARTRIYDRFYQASVPPDSHSPRGSGLGLTLVRLIAERHRGRVTCEPRRKGTVFTLTLPRG